MLKVTYATRGLEALRGQKSDAHLRAASMALNVTVAKTRTLVVNKLGQEIAFPPGYLDPAGGRLAVDGAASPTSLHVKLRARGRPTSLIRFAAGAGVGRRDKVSVQVKPGNAVVMPRAFAVRLRSGNMGLAMRLRPGESPRNKREMVQMRNGLWLLYGPSVAQGFRLYLDKEALVAQTEATMQAEFDRYWRVVANG